VVSQETILCDFVAATNAATELSNWKCSEGLPSSSICRDSQSNWFGVSCDRGHVTSLYIYSYTLSGTIPSSIGHLQSLTSLSLSYSQLHGHIPTSLGLLSNLDSLSLQAPQLSGTLPSSLGQLAALKHLTISLASVSGSLPASFCHLNLSTLYLYNVGHLTCYPRCWDNLYRPQLSSSGLQSCVTEGTVPEYTAHMFITQ